MITARRESFETVDVRNQAKSRLGLLERTQNTAYNEVSNYESEQKVISPSEDKERMANNFNMLLNYEKFIEDTKRQEKEEVSSSVQASVSTPVQENAPQTTQSANEDLMPSKTTRQFGPEEISNVYSDMKQVTAKQSKYHLNSQGKLMIALYAIVVTVIMALIVINTSVLAMIKNQNAAKTEELYSLSEQYNALEEEYNHISSDEYVIEKATGEYNMVK